MQPQDLLNEIRKKNFKMDIPSFLLQIQTTNLKNSYYLDTILRKQIEIIALVKGKKGDELDDCINKEIEHYNKLYSEFLVEDILNSVEEIKE